MYTKRITPWFVGLVAVMASLLGAAATANAEEIKAVLDAAPSSASHIDDITPEQCADIASLYVTCNPDKSRLRATVLSDLPWGTRMTLVADDAFYRRPITNWRGKARAVWFNPMPGLHEVCIAECGICATTVCGCATDADCDDGEFCNGAETCDAATGECLPGELPCAEGEICDEGNDVCMTKTIVFAAQMEPGGSYNIYSVNPDGSDLVNLAPDFGQDMYRPAVSPDGRQIAFFTSGAGAALYVMDGDGSAPRVVRSGEIWSMVRWYDDATLVHTWRPVSDCANEIRMIDIDGQNDRLFLPSGCLGQNQWPQFDFSPDRTWIALSAQIGCWSPTTDLYVADVDCLLNEPADCTECVECLYTDPGDDNVDQWPCWGHDNQTVLLSHQINPGVYAPTAIVQTTLSSSCQEYDEVVIPPFDPDPHSDMHAECVLGDGNLIVYTKFLHPGPATLCVWDREVGGDVWCSDAYNVNGADCGFLQIAGA